MSVIALVVIPSTSGGPDSDWSTVRRFYDYWLAFATVKEFAWADVYNLAAAPNRKVRHVSEGCHVGVAVVCAVP